MISSLVNLLQKLLNRKRFQIYTDGSQKKAWGAWAFVVIQNNKVIHESSGREKYAGSNHMEFKAIQNALSFLPENAEAEIFADSRIVINAMNRIKQPKAYQKQIEELTQLSQNKKIKWTWIKAHSGVAYNERCDELCIQARNSI